jgi:hypothetical protein
MSSNPQTSKIGGWMPEENRCTCPDTNNYISLRFIWHAVPMVDNYAKIIPGSKLFFCIYMLHSF